MNAGMQMIDRLFSIEEGRHRLRAWLVKDSVRRQWVSLICHPEEGVFLPNEEPALSMPKGSGEPRDASLSMRSAGPRNEGRRRAFCDASMVRLARFLSKLTHLPVRKYS